MTVREVFSQLEPGATLYCSGDADHPVSCGERQGFALLGHAAPDFALRSFSGTNVRLSEDRGDVVVLTFWGSQCDPCRKQLQALDRSLTTYRSAACMCTASAWMTYRSMRGGSSPLTLWA